MKNKAVHRCRRAVLACGGCLLLMLMPLRAAFGAAPVSADEAAGSLHSVRGLPPPKADDSGVVPAGTVLTAPPLEAPATPGALASPPEGVATATGQEKLTTEERQALETACETARKNGDMTGMREALEQLVRKGDARAMNRLGLLFDRGLGVEPDAGRAVYWFARAAAAGDPAGMANYGRMLQQGKGVSPDAREAARWLYLAAKQGQREAQYNLGLMYERGHGVPRDDKAAAAWYSRAAAQDQPEALARLGHFFRTGTGVAKNIPRATLLLHGAAMCGNEDAIRELKELAEEKPARTQAVMVGQRLDATDRAAMRKALRTAGLRPTRESDDFVCDVYDPAGKVPGAAQVAACYGPARGEAPARLGFLKIDYPASGPEFVQRLNTMMAERFGPAAAGEADDAKLWNLGDIVIATQYMPDHRQVGLMYMVPEVYHLTQAR